MAESPSPVRVLLVDDNPPLLASAGRVLREAGYTVTSTNSGADAICLLGAKPPPDLLILDVIMPYTDGLAVLAQLGPTSPPVVLMSGAPIPEGELTTGKVVRVLTKPFDLSQLLEAVRAALARSGASATDAPAGDCP